MPPHEDPKRIAGESTPLLLHEHQHTPCIDNLVRDEELAWSSRVASILEPQKQHDASIWRNELEALVQLAVPVIGACLLGMLPGIESIVLVGHLQHERAEEYLDATAVAVMFQSVFGLSIGYGLSSAMDTLCSQAYGAQESHRMGTYLQTGILVLSAFMILVGVAFYHCEDILIALGQPKVVSQLAGTYALYLLPSVPFLFLYELLRKVLQAQNIAKPMLYTSLAANVVNVSLGYYLVYHTSWGWLGSAVARSASNLTYVVLLLPYVVASGLTRTCWTGINIKDAIHGIPQFLALGIPGMLQMCFEWWAFEVLAVLCGLLPNAVVAIGANAVILNVASLVYMTYMGLSVSCNVRVGNALGANDPRRAQLAAQLTLGMTVVAAVASATALVAGRKLIPQLMTHDQAINELATRLLLVAAVFQIPDGVNATVQATFRGSGRQSMGAAINFVAYYVLGIPVACLMAFSLHLGVVGLWMGVTASLTLAAGCGTFLIWKSDWDWLAQQAQMRIKEDAND
jgi:multidrug resistance protein, MATE family